MESSLAAYIMNIAPGKKRAEWHQKGVHRVLRDWAQTRSEWYEFIVDESPVGVAVGYHTYPSGLGENGYDTGYYFAPDLDPQFIERDDSEELCTHFFNAWMQQIVSIIKEEQESTLFSPKEFATLIAYRNPYQSERKAADALEVSVGTYRGKVGRVKQKLETAKATLSTDSAINIESKDDWSGSGYAAALNVIDRVPEDRLPIQSVHSTSSDRIKLDDIPVDDLILDG
ncbi:hypothetical protein C453_12706 [Haloferax elongans ATCC BAA-1513]|uniref:Uncharacterized protein n=1 Tax=Haloferax elongans ATCC BAA-1513 TaxID=1230453 RepID=M0HIT6_HALEO|nr:hypothetical protein [Haloferax elongans]ELZ84406.1 hypothetical protein C453_12706 [Haloferax elongans ATCC BAA-1513]